MAVGYKRATEHTPGDYLPTTFLAILQSDLVWSQRAKVHCQLSSTADFTPLQYYSRVVPSNRFQALFNPSFEVLFTVRSHYLFAIGDSVIFSLRGDLPAASRSNPKLRDSLDWAFG